MVVGIESYFSEVSILWGKNRERPTCTENRRAKYIERQEWRTTFINQNYRIESRVLTTIHEIQA